MRDERDILTACALRFDGYAYIDDTGFDFEAALAGYFRDGAWPEPLGDRLAIFFTLQRFLCKWGGERESKRGRYWRAYRALFLETCAEPTPEAYRSPSYADEWEQRYAPHLDECVAIVGRAHRNTRYHVDRA